jgi:hypothetical protein
MLVVGCVLSVLGDENNKAQGPRAKKKAPNVQIERKAPKPPRVVELPDSGVYPAEEILALAGVLSGRAVRLSSERLRQTEVTISEDIAGSNLTLAELTLLLAAHRLYLFAVTDPRDGEILLVSKDPEWSDEPPRFTLTLDTIGMNFKEAATRVRKALKSLNTRLPAGELPVFSLPDKRTGKIIVGASTQATLDKVSQLLNRYGLQKQQPNRPRLYSYKGRFRRVEDLAEEVTKDLSKGERNVLRIVRNGRGNRLLFRSPPELWKKLKLKFEELDQPTRR